MSVIVNKIRRSVARDRSLPLGALIQKAAAFAAGIATAPYRLRAANRVGKRARTLGAPVVRNLGTLEIGDDVVLNSQFAPCELQTLHGGHILLGHHVAINFGSSIAAATSITLGNHVSLGPYCLLCDHDGLSDGSGQPITLEDGVWLAGHVTVLPGAHVGAGSVITAGSVVDGAIPAGVVAGGNPARVIRQINAPDGPSPAAAVSEVSLPTTTPPTAQPARWTGVVLSDFTPGDLVARLQASSDASSMAVLETPYGQVMSVLLEGARADARDFAVVWTRPEAAIPSFQRVIANETVDATTLRADVDAYCDVLLRGADTWRVVFAVSWVRPPALRGRGMLDHRIGGVSWALGIMNQHFMQRLEAADRIFLLDAQRWIDAAGDTAYSTRGWYFGKIPFGTDVFAEAAQDLQASMRALVGETRKLIVVDLDDTMWGGVVGDVGWENLVLGGHDAEGEAHVDFQRALKRLASRGILLAIASKNSESVALEAIELHPEMQLRKADFVSWRINWSDKAQNIADLAAELNLGLQSVVFLDDNPVERARVRTALPEVLVPEWPTDKLQYPQALAALRCFDVAAISDEDVKRRELYALESQRAASLTQSVGSLDDWLAGLDIRVHAELLSARTLPRVTQLLNKTNQMNIATRRLTEAELSAWAALPNRELWALSVGDKFGDAGLTGILGLEAVGRICVVTDFILSCRVMGRCVEETMTHLAVSRAIAMHVGVVEAPFHPTKKNKPCLDYFLRSGFEMAVAADGATTFRRDTATPYERPSVVKLVVELPHEMRV